MDKQVECPNCGTTDFDTAENGTVGYCIVGCGAMFSINEDGSTVITGHVEPLVQPFGIFPKEEWLNGA